jgi:hypothetical protein
VEVDRELSTSVLILRVWAEGPMERGLRVRIVAFDDVLVGAGREMVSGSIDDACSVVRSWLESLYARTDLTP